MKKLVRITTVPISLEKLLEDQGRFFKNHYDITYVAADAPKLKAIAEQQGVKHFPLDMTRKITPLKDLRCLLRLYRFLRRDQPFIVHTHTPKAGIIGMLAAYIARVPIRMHTVAGLPLMEASGLKRIILYTVERITYRCATHVYPNSKGLMEFIKKEKLAGETPLHCIGEGSSNGIDMDYFNPDNISSIEVKAKQNSWGISSDDFIFLFIGRLVSDKGINELVGAFEEVSGRISNAKLVLVGQQEPTLDPLNKTTLKAIEENPNIISTGFQQDVRAFLKMAQVFVFPSYREGFPNVVLQAGAMGVPSIVSDINGCNEIITNQINGQVIPVKDQKALQENMCFLYENPTIRESYVAKTKRIIANDFERKQYWELLLQEYQLREKNV